MRDKSLELAEQSLTQAEEHFKVIQQKRQLSKVKHNLKLNYREKIDKFN